MSTCVIVLGTPRSGTSVTAGILHKMGVSMGPTNFHPPGGANPKGFFEFQQLANLHARKSGSVDFKGVARAFLQASQGKTYDIAPGQELTIYKNTLNRIAKEHEFWGFKDPRILLPHFFITAVRIIESMQHYIKIVHTNRPEKEIALSLQRVTSDLSNEDAQKAIRYALQRQQEILHGSPYPVLEVKLLDLLDRPHEIVESIAYFVGVNVPKDFDWSFINPQLRQTKVE